MKKQQKKTKTGINTLVWKEGNLYVAQAIEIDVTSQGKSTKKALMNLEEALELYFEDEKITSKSILTRPNLKLHKLFPKIHYA